MDIALETLNMFAAASTVALFILEVWRTWKEHKREDDVGGKSKGQLALTLI